VFRQADSLGSSENIEQYLQEAVEEVPVTCKYFILMARSERYSPEVAAEDCILGFPLGHPSDVVADPICTGTQLALPSLRHRIEWVLASVAAPPIAKFESAVPCSKHRVECSLACIPDSVQMS
jgi:hypothetical protein